MRERLSQFVRNVLPFAPAIALVGAGVFAASVPMILIGVAVAGIHYELYKVKTKVENSEPWY